MPSIRSTGFLTYEMQFLLPGTILFISLLSFTIFFNLIDINIILNSDISILAVIIAIPLIIPLLYLLGRILHIFNPIIDRLIVKKEETKAGEEIKKTWDNLKNKKKIKELFDSIRLDFNFDFEKDLVPKKEKNKKEEKIRRFKKTLWDYFYWLGRGDLINLHLNLAIMTKYTSIALLILIFSLIPWLFRSSYSYLIIFICLYCVIQIIINIHLQKRFERLLIIRPFKFLCYFALEKKID